MLPPFYGVCSLDNVLAPAHSIITMQQRLLESTFCLCSSALASRSFRELLRLPNCTADASMMCTGQGNIELLQATGSVRLMHQHSIK